MSREVQKQMNYSSLILGRRIRIRDTSRRNLSLEIRKQNISLKHGSHKCVRQPTQRLLVFCWSAHVRRSAKKKQQQQQQQNMKCSSLILQRQKSHSTLLRINLPLETKRDWNFGKIARHLPSRFPQYGQ